MASIEEEEKMGSDVEFVDVESDEAIADDDDDDEEEVVPFVPGKSNVDEDTEMVQDDTAYVMYHQAQTGRGVFYHLMAKRVII